MQAAVIGLLANGPKAEASAVLIYLSTLYLEAYEIWRPCAVAHAAHAQGRPCDKTVDIAYLIRKRIANILMQKCGTRKKIARA